MAANAHPAGISSRRISTQKYLAETTRKRLPPLLGLGLAGATLFGAFLAWLFLSDPLSPQERYARDVGPLEREMHEKEGRRDWAGALRACDEAIRKTQDLGRDFSPRVQELKACRRQFVEFQQRDREADTLAEGFKRRVDEFVAAPFTDPAARYRKARELAREGEDLLGRVAGTPAEARVKACLDVLKSVPPPSSSPTWFDLKRRVNEMLARDEYAEALGQVEAFVAGSSGTDRKNAEGYRSIVETRAREYFRRRYPPDKTLEERIRETGRGTLLERVREDRPRLKGTAAEKNLQALASALER
jgi:hypothetical protein